MKFAKARNVLLVTLYASAGGPTFAQDAAQIAPAARQSQTVRVIGTVRDETNAIALPGVPVEVVGTGQVVYTDVDGRYVLQVPPGRHQIKVVLEGYQEKLLNVEASDRATTADVGLMMARFAETVRNGITELGTGSEARIKLRLHDKTKLDGYVSRAGTDSFAVIDANGVERTVLYPDVTQVSGQNLRTRWKIVIGAAIVAGIIITLYIVRGAFCDGC